SVIRRYKRSCIPELWATPETCATCRIEEKLMMRELSRRTFIRTATGLISANWGGLRILAGPPFALAQSSQSSQSGPSPQEFIYGTEFFRPPNPPRALRHEMLRAIAHEYKFNIIRIY